MPLTVPQLDVLAADIAAQPILAALPKNSDSAVLIADVYNAIASPVYWVYKTSLREDEVYEQTSSDGTTWSWTTFMAQTVTERETWALMFRRGTINPALPQARTGITQIFGGSTAPVVTQRTHLTALFRRRATVGEKLLIVPASGAGTTASPATMGFEGALRGWDVEQAWAH